MKRTVRNGIFETNSSSVHVIAISKEEPKKPPSSIVFGHGEFGWEFSYYSDSYSKANYFNEAIQAMCGNKYWNDEEKRKEEVKAIQDKIIACLAERGIEAVFEPDIYEQYESMRYYESGYIDHGTELIGWVNELLEDTDKLIRFLFSSDSYVETGNDNVDSEDIPKAPDEDKFDVYEKWN